METSNKIADCTEVSNSTLTALTPPNKKTEAEELNHFTEDEDDFDISLDDDMISLDELDSDDDDY